MRKLEDITHVVNYIPRASDVDPLDLCMVVVCNTQTKNLAHIKECVIKVIKEAQIPSHSKSNVFNTWFKQQIDLKDTLVYPIQSEGQDMIYNRGMNYLYTLSNLGLIMPNLTVLFEGRPLHINTPLPRTPYQIDDWVASNFDIDFELGKFGPT